MTAFAPLLVILRFLDCIEKSLLEQKLYLLIQSPMFTFCEGSS
jgi:hypothetical protein